MRVVLLDVKIRGNSLRCDSGPEPASAGAILRAGRRRAGLRR